MYIRDISFSEPEKNILFDEVLLHLAEQEEAGEALRFWESPQTFIVLGKIGKAEEDIHLDRTEKDEIPVLRRSSGGGTVVQGSGCLNYSLILSKEQHSSIHDLRKSYQYILTKVIEALGSLGIEGMFMPISDIALKNTEKKFSGNAQKRGRKYILHHGTVLYNFDLSLIERYLKIPRDVPEYRRGRGHLEFVTNVNVSGIRVKEALAKMFPVSKFLNILTKEEKNCLENKINSLTLPYGKV